MNDKLVKVKFSNHHETIKITLGQTILDAARIAGIPINAPCGGSGICGKCLVRVTEGQTGISKEERSVLTKTQLQNGIRLACKSIPVTDITVDPGLSEGFEQILLTDASENVELNPVIKKKFINFTKPSLEGLNSHCDLLREHFPSLSIGVDIYKKAAKLFANQVFDITVAYNNARIIDLEKGNTEQQIYGVCIDIGTTTVAAKLINLFNGDTETVSSGLNKQKIFGDDVLSRINYCSQEEKNLETISKTIVDQINSMITDMLSKIEVSGENVYCVTVAGNTTMLQLFAGIDTFSLGQMPFSNTLKESISELAEIIGLTAIHPKASVYLMPVIGSFVGGDTTACISSVDMHKSKGTTLLIDIGTNGEIVLNNNGVLTASSTAAGPALEGANISCGMLATSGAIDKCIIDGDDILITTISNRQPCGICGSGLIDAIAVMLDLGVINELGHFTGHPETLSQAIRERIRIEDGKAEFVLADTDKIISVTQRDIRELQLACGAIRAGITIILKQSGLDITQLDSVLLAGGFGNFIDKVNACKVGIIPNIEPEKIISIGNAALAGARKTLINADCRKEIEEATLKIKHVELSLDMGFQMEFAEAMIFPQK